MKKPIVEDTDRLDPKHLLDLRESEEHYRFIVETTNEGIWTMDGQHHTSYVNLRMAQMLDYSPAEMLGKRIDSFMFPEDGDSHSSQMRARQQGHEGVYERRFRRRDGSELWTIVSAKALVDEQGKFIGSFAMITDITERKQAEIHMERAFRALKAERDMMQRYLETAGTIIVALDAQGHVTMLNRYGLALLGYAEHEIVGRNWFQKVLPQPEGRERVLPVFQAIMRGELEQSTYHENEVLTASGERRNIAWRNTFLRDELGKPIGTLSSGMDLHDRREAERKINRLQKADSLRRMAGAIAHHFNNQLHAVMGNIELAAMELPSGSQSARCIEEAMGAARKAVDLSATMLTYLGQSFTEHHVHDLSELCRRALAAIRSQVREGIELLAELPSPGPCVNADADQIAHLLANFILNSMEAIATGSGTIRVCVETWPVKDIPHEERFPGDWLPDKENYAGLTVMDTGCGIAPGDIDRLFDPFFTSKMTGRGLGLPEALGIARSHEGMILVHSVPGQGSCFRLILPVFRQQEE